MITINNFRSRFHQTFLPSKKMQANGVWKKNHSSISPTKLKAKITGQNSTNLCKNSPNAFRQKGVEFCAKMLMKSTSGVVNLKFDGINVVCQNDIVYEDEEKFVEAEGQRQNWELK